MAIGRIEELRLPEARYRSPRFEFGYLYGRRGIGKTPWVEMVAQGKTP